MKLFKIMTVALLCSTVSSTASAALVQGTTGTSSVGSFDVQVQILEELKVSTLANTPMAGTGTNTGAFYVPGGGDMVSTAPACIYYNNSDNVKIQLDSLNGAGAGFSLVNAGDSIAYTVEVKGDQSTATVASHADGAIATYGIRPYAVNDDCDGLAPKYTSDIIATVTDTGLPIAVANGVYTDTITVTITP
jgi:hypothetical protein